MESEIEFFVWGWIFSWDSDFIKEELFYRKVRCNNFFKSDAQLNPETIKASLWNFRNWKQNYFYQIFMHSIYVIPLLQFKKAFQFIFAINRSLINLSFLSNQWSILVIRLNLLSSWNNGRHWFQSVCNV